MHTSRLQSHRLFRYSFSIRTLVPLLYRFIKHHHILFVNYPSVVLQRKLRQCATPATKRQIFSNLYSNLHHSITNPSLWLGNHQANLEHILSCRILSSNNRISFDQNSSYKNQFQVTKIMLEEDPKHAFSG